MCGIFLSITRAATIDSNADENAVKEAQKGKEFVEKAVRLVETEVQKRGPDYCGNERVRGENGNDDEDGLLHIKLLAAVLHLRGKTMQPQPLRDSSSGNTLAFNGELYGIRNDNGNDTLFLSDLLKDSAMDGETRFLEMIGRLRGEWSLVYHIKKSNCLYFGRDFLGRRSLMMKSCPFTSSFYLSSVSGGAMPLDEGDDEWKELECTGLYKLDLKKLLGFCKSNPSLPLHVAQHVEHLSWITSIPHPILYQASQARASAALLNESDIPSISANGENDVDLSILPKRLRKDQLDAKAALFNVLSEAVYQRVFSIPPLPSSTTAPSALLPQPARLAILFSGGLDCMVLAALASAHLEEDEPIDLLNVAFENPRAIQAKKEGKQNQSNGVKLNKSKKEKKKSNSRKDLGVNIHSTLAEDEAVKNVAEKEEETLANTGSTRSVTIVRDGNENSAADDLYDTPDRKTAILGHDELCRLYPNRRWRLVLINISHKEATGQQQGQQQVQQRVDSHTTLSRHHQDYILKLMHPLCTVMDLSIAMAFYFASRGQGGAVRVNSKLEKVPTCTSTSQTDRDGVLQVDTLYCSSARVLLSGLGADEQLGGYSRHRAAFEKRGWQGLQEEIELDCARIGQRNLGRDDRIISSHGKEVRFPYLDEDVYVFLSSLPVHVKTDPRWARSVGDKMLLRLVASEELGLHRAGVEAKRAVQFGARTAKMELGTRSVRGHEMLV